MPKVIYEYKTSYVQHKLYKQQKWLVEEITQISAKEKKTLTL